MALSKKKKGILFAMFLFFTLLCFIGGLYGGGAAYYKLTNISLEHLTYHSLFDQWQAYSHNPDIKKFLVIGVAVKYRHHFVSNADGYRDSHCQPRKRRNPRQCEVRDRHGFGELRSFS
nr:hypothetical protein [Vibrio harveyi]